MTFIERRRSGLLAQLVTVPVNHDGQVSIVRRGKIEKALQINLPGSGVEQVAATHDVRDPLIGIIHDDSQLIGKPAVSAADYEIAHFACQTVTAVTLNGVVKENRHIINPQTDSAGTAGMTDARSAMAGINRATIAGVGTSRQLSSGAGAGIG